MTYKIVTGHHFEKERRVIATSVEMAQGLAAVAWDVYQLQTDVFVAVATGDEQRLNELGEAARVAMEMSLEMIEAVKEVLLDVPVETVGRVIGAILYEVAEAYVTVGAAKLTKLGAISKVSASATKIADKTLEGLTSAKSAFVAVFQETSEHVGRIAKFVKNLNKYPDICFVAGTPVHTRSGLVAIEQVKVGELVVARDELTGEQTWKRVLTRFETHPDQLVAIYITPTDRPEDAPEEVICTPNHPFFDSVAGQFVHAGELVVGSHLLLTDGRPAKVREVQAWKASPGETFTTYNIEVEDFHTYFVGRLGAWVHNASDSLCATAIGIFTNTFDEATEIKLTEAVKKTTDFVASAVKKSQLISDKSYDGLGSVWNKLGEIAELAVKESTAAGIPILPGAPAEFWRSRPKRTWLETLSEHFATHVLYEKQWENQVGVPQVTDLVTWLKRVWTFHPDNVPSHYTVIERLTNQLDGGGQQLLERVVLNAQTGEVAFFRKAQSGGEWLPESFYRFDKNLKVDNTSYVPIPENRRFWALSQVRPIDPAAAIDDVNALRHGVQRLIQLGTL